MTEDGTDGKAEKDVTPQKRPASKGTKAVAKRKPVEKQAEAVEIDPNRLIMVAMEKGYDPSIVKEFLAMRKELQEEWAKRQYYTAFAQFQKECPAIPKNHEAVDRHGNHRYWYADYDDVMNTIREPLASNGFSISSSTKQADDLSWVEGTAILHHKDGHEEHATVRVPIIANDFMNPIQHVGEARSYAARYATLDVTGQSRADGDDDANGFTAGVKYADYVNAIDATTDAADCYAVGGRYYNELKEAGDQEGMKVILKAFKAHAAELEKGASK